MPSLFTHGIFAILAAKLIQAPKRRLGKVLFLGIFCAVIPDADVIAFKFGIPYEHPFGHRGFTHSVLFAFILAVFSYFLARRKSSFTTIQSMAVFFYFLICGLSHSVFDAMTNGGLGVAFFFPFENSRYFLPWQPIQVSPIGVRAFFSETGWRVMKSEMITVWLPSAALAVSAGMLRKIVYIKPRPWVGTSK